LTIRVVKADGSMEEFQPRKILRTMRSAGASDEAAKTVLKEIEGVAYDGITTREILKRVKALLQKEELHTAMRYDLKGAMMRMGPAGFAFETFISEILSNYRYKTKLRSILQGRCVQHEVDVIAERTSGAARRCLIECKYHNMAGLSVELKDVLYTYARFLDLNEGSKIGKGERFDEVWLVSNTRPSHDAAKYASCRGMKLLCWRCPKGRGLEEMIAEKKLYPVTILRSVDRMTLNNLFLAGLMLAKDLVTHNMNYLKEKTKLSEEKLRKLVSEAKELMS
jgi:hypothetical protein